MSDAPVLQTLAGTVVATLGDVRQQDGPSVAYQIAVSNIFASTHFLLNSIGPQAARMALAKTADALEEDIKFANANSEFLS